ncbi:MAG: hypothetical protein BWY69_00886 [Planctomycetes bacterium ADurb.Bin401]|nr:MAG: hypothetical protein BWY69_00886 [Planctomycetes bacterium ADurb.Bin401]
MTYKAMKEAKKYAQEFIKAVNRFEQADSEQMTRDRLTIPSKENQSIWQLPREAGLVRHWSVILSRALADMRNR